MRFRAIEGRVVENFMVLDKQITLNHKVVEKHLDEMAERDKETAMAVQDLRTQMAGYTKILCVLNTGLEKIDRRTQWFNGMFITFLAAFATALMIYLVGR